MLKNKKLTYISLFSSAGVGCFGFKQEDYECVATNEFIQRRLDVQKFNKKCSLDSGYICGDIKLDSTKKLIFDEIKKYKTLGNDDIDVLIATPPCQGMSVANHKKTAKEIERNSLVVESIILTKSIKPKVFLFENVSAFLTTGCTAPDGTIKEIRQVIYEQLNEYYEIVSRVINFKNYGSNSSRTRTLVIGIRKDYDEYISPIDLFPNYQNERTLRDVIGKYKSLSWGEIDKKDILHAFRTYPKEMEEWIDGLKAGESAFNNGDNNKKPHKVVNGKIVLNVNKNGDKYTRQDWDKVAPCIHTRNDQLASQNTIHPVDNRVFSIRELMDLMTIPKEFKWSDEDYKELNDLDLSKKIEFYRNNEIKIRQSIGEAVPTTIFRQIANKIKQELIYNTVDLNIDKIIKTNKLDSIDKIINFIKINKNKYSISALSKIAEMANGRRLDTDAYYTNKILLNKIFEQMPTINKDEIFILEPSVGTGNFLPYIFKKYESVKKVNLDINDIDNNSIKIAKILLSKTKIPKNFNIRYLNNDYLKIKNEHYDLVVGNPPFTKVSRLLNKDYFTTSYNTDTRNLAVLFLEKAISMADYVCMIQPKYIINTAEFSKTRELLSKFKIDSIYDFGEKGFKGVLIETVCISLSTIKKPNLTQIKSIPFRIDRLTKQKTLTSDDYPYWLLYRNDYFDNVAQKMTFNKFAVFRDRQITKKDIENKKGKYSIRVLKSRNIKLNGQIEDIKGYDGYIRKKVLEKKAIYKYFNKDVYLVPNMTYIPRMIKNPKNVTVNGSIAILIPKDIKPNSKQIKYFSSDEFREFYRIARNYQTRSLNIDETSVFFFGLLK